MYCGSPAKTNEHIIATRFIDVLREDPRQVTLPIVLYAALPSGQERRIPGKRLKRRRFTLEYTTRVCSRCNNEWMKRLEDAVIPVLKPMMLGEGFTLNASALAALAAWATKTALVFELVQQDGATTASAADRLWFKAHRSPLPGSRIWAARYVGTLGKAWQSRSMLMTYDLDDPSSVPSPHGLVVVLAYGQVALRVAMVRSEPTLPARFAVTDDERAPTIWPTMGQLAWPPLTTLDDDGLVNFGAVHLPEDGAGSLQHYGPPSHR